MRFLPSRETHGSRAPSFVGANFLHFGSLKVRFLEIRETNVSRFYAMSVEIFYIFDAGKCDFRLMERVHSIDGNSRAEVVRVSLGEGQ